MAGRGRTRMEHRMTANTLLFVLSNMVESDERVEAARAALIRLRKHGLAAEITACQAKMKRIRKSVMSSIDYHSRKEFEEKPHGKA